MGQKLWAQQGEVESWANWLIRIHNVPSAGGSNKTASSGPGYAGMLVSDGPTHGIVRQSLWAEQGCSPKKKKVQTVKHTRKLGKGQEGLIWHKMG